MSPSPRGSPLGPIHFVVDVEGPASAPSFLPSIEALFVAGLSSIQLRMKSGAKRDIDPRSRRIRALAREHGARFMVNAGADTGRAVEAARRLDADGIHLPAAGPTAVSVREAFGAPLLVGRSAHDAKELALAVDHDWVFLSPLFPTSSKPGVSALGPARFAQLAARSPAPVLALGGITRENVATAIASGAAGIAAISALLAKDGAEFVREVRALAARSSPSPPLPEST